MVFLFSITFEVSRSLNVPHLTQPIRAAQPQPYYFFVKYLAKRGFTRYYLQKQVFLRKSLFNA